MRKIQMGVAMAWMVCFSLAGNGCASTSASRGGDDATSPQDKARQTQLSEMSQDDAESATIRKIDKTKPASRNRRSGQRVVDQPVGRR